MSKFSSISTLHLLTASAMAMVALLGMTSSQLLRDLLPEAHAEAPKTAAEAAPVVVQTPAAVDLPAPPVSSEEKKLLEDLRARKKDLDARESSLDVREAALAAAEKRLDDRVAELKQLQDSLQQRQDQADQKNDANWQNLVAVYEAMKPQAAASILNNLDMPVVLQIFDRMQNRKAALILSDMDPDRARLVTVQLSKMRTAQLPASPTSS